MASARLVHDKLINNLLVNWHELQAYFACTEVSGSANALHKARTLDSVLQDGIN